MFGITSLVLELNHELAEAPRGTRISINPEGPKLTAQAAERCLEQHQVGCRINLHRACPQPEGSATP